jgi:hypothetical protein
MRYVLLGSVLKGVLYFGALRRVLAVILGKRFTFTEVWGLKRSNNTGQTSDYNGIIPR